MKHLGKGTVMIGMILGITNRYIPQTVKISGVDNQSTLHERAFLLKQVFVLNVIVTGLLTLLAIAGIAAIVLGALI